jgi:hypothetical protein
MQAQHARLQDVRMPDDASHVLVDKRLLSRLWRTRGLATGGPGLDG